MVGRIWTLVIAGVALGCVESADHPVDAARPPDAAIDQRLAVDAADMRRDQALDATPADMRRDQALDATPVPDRGPIDAAPIEPDGTPGARVDERGVPTCETPSDCQGYPGYDDFCTRGRCCWAHGCIECLDDSHCSAGSYCAGHGCNPCREDAHCPPERPLCVHDGIYGRYYCAECRVGADCPEERPICHVEGESDRWCVACEFEIDCPDGQRCLDERCTECLLDRHCEAGQVCIDERCVEQE